MEFIFFQILSGMFILFPLLPCNFIRIPGLWVRAVHAMVYVLLHIISTYVTPAGNLTIFYILILNNTCGVVSPNPAGTNPIFTIPAEPTAFHICAPVSKFILGGIKCYRKMSTYPSTSGGCNQVATGQQANISQDIHQ
ncbi:p110_7L [African swine fever virus]|uniref:p110_7L n=1 Tax=African swine fever virus TaxID=10497 RepID=A0A8A1V276_ASF|nr:p110_7L [African swine fever virus]